MKKLLMKRTFDESLVKILNEVKFTYEKDFKNNLRLPTAEIYNLINNERYNVYLSVYCTNQLDEMHI